VLQTGLARPDLIALQHAAEEAAAAKQGRRRPASTQAELRMAGTGASFMWIGVHSLLHRGVRALIEYSGEGLLGEERVQ
jgi:hypothetical protein